MAWSGGIAEWFLPQSNTTCISVAFTYLLGDAYERAQRAAFFGRKVVVGGPALFLMREGKMHHPITLIAAIGDTYPDALRFHNPDATIASRGCPVGCHFCIVPKMEGAAFTLIPDFPVRPVLCDNNLSALPADYQQHIIDRYRGARVSLTDANSGFEPITFTPEVYERWKDLINAGGGPWRFAYDELKEGPQVRRVMTMLEREPARRKRVYVLIGNEPVADCMLRIQEVIDHDCEPHVQPFIDLNASRREPRARFDWTPQQMRDVARWANGRLWRQMPFESYDRTARKPREAYDAQQGLFL